VKWDGASLCSTYVEMKNALCCFLIKITKVFLVIYAGILWKLNCLWRCRKKVWGWRKNLSTKLWVLFPTLIIFKNTKSILLKVVFYTIYITFYILECRIRNTFFYCILCNSKYNFLYFELCNPKYNFFNISNYIIWITKFFYILNYITWITKKLYFRLYNLEYIKKFLF